MKHYLMLFKHSPFGVYSYVFEAKDDTGAREKAIKRLAQSGPPGMSFEVMEIRHVIHYQTWKKVVN